MSEVCYPGRIQLVLHLLTACESNFCIDGCISIKLTRLNPPDVDNGNSRVKGRILSLSMNQ
jgi:hypothetical protein